MSEKRELYRGTAKVISTDFVNFTTDPCKEWKPWERDAVLRLPEKSQADAMKIVITVRDDEGVVSDILLPYYEEELTGEAINWYRREDARNPTRMDETLCTLMSQNLIASKTDEELTRLITTDTAVGKPVYILRYETLGKDGVKWWPDVKFERRIKLLRGGDRAARLAAFREGKPYVAPSASVAAPAQNAIPAPSDDDMEMPF